MYTKHVRVTFTDLLKARLVFYLFVCTPEDSREQYPPTTPFILHLHSSTEEHPKYS